MKVLFSLNSLLLIWNNFKATATTIKIFLFGIFSEEKKYDKTSLDFKGTIAENYTLLW